MTVTCRVCGNGLTLSGDLWRNGEGVAFCPREPCEIVRQYEAVQSGLSESKGVRAQHDSACACLSMSLLHIPIFPKCHSEDQPNPTETRKHMSTMTLENGDTLTLNVPVNVKVKGEQTMRKDVRLVENSSDSVRVLTGKRGRPATLPVAEIQKVTVLTPKPEPKTEKPDVLDPK